MPSRRSVLTNNSETEFDHDAVQRSLELTPLPTNPYFILLLIVIESSQQNYRENLCLSIVLTTSTGW